VRGKSSGVEVKQEAWGVFSFRSRRIVRIEWFSDRGEALEATGLGSRYLVTLLTDGDSDGPPALGRGAPDAYSERFEKSVRDWAEFQDWDQGEG
jgi:hypothetical protein